jgi:hypothetical protein
MGKIRKNIRTKDSGKYAALRKLHSIMILIYQKIRVKKKKDINKKRSKESEIAMSPKRYQTFRITKGQKINK